MYYVLLMIQSLCNIKIYIESEKYKKSRFNRLFILNINFYFSHVPHLFLHNKFFHFYHEDNNNKELILGSKLLLLILDLDYL